MILFNKLPEAARSGWSLSAVAHAGENRGWSCGFEVQTLMCIKTLHLMHLIMCCF